VSVVALVAFVARELKCNEPIVQLRILLNRNFAVGALITGLYGFVLYSSTALLPLFLQTLLGYPALDSGLAVSPRGIGSMVSMVVAGALAEHMDARLMVMVGFLILGVSTLMLGNVNLGIAMTSVVVPNLLNGFAGGFIFVPLTTLTMGKLRKREIGNAAGIYNLVRNIGGSVGIASATTLLVRRSQVHQNYLAAHLTATDTASAGMAQGLAAKLSLAGVDSYTAHHKALGAIYEMVQQQASLLSYIDNFRLLAVLAFLCLPLAALFRRAPRHG
jgi:DHA2 family multidrug resistance protein